ncbi:hypothetical protein [Pedobacter gandavensis]|uniref:hypothetical protein n=1 Tax=Pedobacter gandavensis TaxID=2679963 RepID=UPI002931A605|nr:hypothetical protein [Pedobacter gandavensis]
MCASKMVSVFKTNVQCPEKAVAVVAGLSTEYPAFRINFDLEDCDNILRIEGIGIQINRIISSMENQGCFCEELPY